MEFKKETAKHLAKKLDTPVSAEEEKRYIDEFVKIVDRVITKIDEKKRVKANLTKEIESCKTKLQYIHTYMRTFEKIKAIASISGLYETLAQEAPRIFNTDRDILKECYRYADGMQIRAGNQPTKENHQIAMEALFSVAKLFNENNVSYTVVGALPCYLLSQGELVRYHEDIDIIVDDKDIPKIVELAKNSELLQDFVITDDREKSPAIIDGFDENGKPKTQGGTPHQVLFQHKNSEFHIGFFQYDEKEDGSRAMKTYYTDKNTNKQVVYHRYSLTPAEWAKEYGEVLLLEGKNGEKINIPCSTIKSVYDKKASDRPKDKFDRELFEGYIDQKEEENSLV